MAFVLVAQFIFLQGKTIYYILSGHHMNEKSSLGSKVWFYIVRQITQHQQFLIPKNLRVDFSLKQNEYCYSV